MKLMRSKEYRLDIQNRWLATLPFILKHDLSGHKGRRAVATVATYLDSRTFAAIFPKLDEFKKAALLTWPNLTQQTVSKLHKLLKSESDCYTMAQNVLDVLGLPPNKSLKKRKRELDDLELNFSEEDD